MAKTNNACCAGGGAVIHKTSIAIDKNAVGNEIACHDDGTGTVVSIKETITTLTEDKRSFTYTNESGATTQILKASKYIPNAGRFYCYTDNRWVTDSDDNYGLNAFQMNESGGTGVDPLVEWEHNGILLKKDDCISRLFFGGHSNNVEVTDLEISVRVVYANPIARYATGIDADGEVTSVEIFRGLYTDIVEDYTGQAYAGNSNDKHRGEIRFDYILPEDAELRIYLKPVGAITATRYFRAHYNWEIY